MSVIPFDGGASFVVRSLPVKQDQPRLVDDLGRTREDRKFLKRFESIFLAAGAGDLDKCQKIVSKGFCDFNAFSVGKFATGSGMSLDRISPLGIAERYGHQNVVSFFKSQMNQGLKPMAKVEREISDKKLEASFNGLQTQSSSGYGYHQQLIQSKYFGQLSEEDRKLYESSMFSYSCLSPTHLHNFTLAAIASPYTDDELEENLQNIINLEGNAEKIASLKNLIEQPFKCKYDNRKKVEIMALIEYLEMHHS